MEEHKQRVPKYPSERVITCGRCGLSGGTLVKIGDNQYAHSDQVTCKLLELRKKRRVIKRREAT